MTSTPLALGIPRFSNPEWDSIAKRDGALSAWSAMAEQGDMVAALATVAGDFAVGVRDGRGRTWLAVDRFAQRSLCYRLDGAVLRFAERADALAGPSEAVSPQAVFDYLYFHDIPSPATIYGQVKRLPPGHYALFENGKLTVAPYWTPRFSEPREASFESLRDEFRQLLLQAVRYQLDGSKPACFLSGGTDSSTVAGMLSQLELGQVSSYSIGFDAQGYDEMAYARLAARRFGTAHHEYYVTPDDLVRSIPAVAAHFDQPFGNSSALPAYYCAKMAREDGVTRLLAGDGGDELFGGNARYAKQRLFARYQQVPLPVRRLLMEPLLGTRAAGALPLTRKAWSYVEQARMPMPDRLQLYNLIMRLGPREVLTPDFLQQVDLQAPLRLQQQVWQAPGPCDALNRELAYDWRFTLAESDLPKVNGATSMAGVSVGFPLLDQALLDFSIKLPLDYKLRGQQLRWFFKEALRGFLPDEIISKKKHGFGLPFGVWTMGTPALLSLARDSLHSLAERGVVRADFIVQLLEHRLQEHPGYYGEMVWILMMLEQWLQAKAPHCRFS
jgi:asparagine synthase (glutamine-hydrolysing)